MNWTALIVFVLLFGFITWLGFVAARWRQGDLDQLHEWGLGGRRFGTVVTWFLLGGDLYTAYTFIAVPALAFGAGAIGFFAVPYTIVIYPLLFLVFPRLWSVCHKHGYITAADFVRGRFGNRWLALAVAITGIVATMPYIALQLVGIQVVIGAMGVSGTGYRGRPAADHRLRHPGGVHLYQRPARAGLIAIVKDVLIYITVFAAIIVIPIQLGGFGKIFAAVPPAKLLLAAPGANSTGAYSAYATLALGSALALFLYPHSITGILSASSGHAIRRNAAMLPAYSLMLGLLALLGFMAHRRRRRQACREFADGFKQFGNNFAVPALFSAQLPGLVRRRRLRGHRHRRAGAGGDHVDRRGQPLHAQHLPRVHQPESDRRRKRRWRSWCRWSSSSARWCSSFRAAAVRDPAAAAGRHLDHPDAAGGGARPLYPLVQRWALLHRLGGRHGDRHLDGRRREPRADLSAGDRRARLPRLHGALHGDPQPRRGRRADAGVQRHEQSPRR